MRNCFKKVGSGKLGVGRKPKTYNLQPKTYLNSLTQHRYNSFV